ncbi:sensor histidine kinase [Planomonospora sp. ID91781]|uniref:sensor histidine kinase n=1 Tax=Planomonospora sp. ID91781 TaxID=2738135 RepID=UPI0018C41F54|nr:ATP-binding protein [Planomonospora sp. ID91781]MBG0819637.1 sensor histidine kinase [Planomonospora sp. ID91781]
MRGTMRLLTDGGAAAGVVGVFWVWPMIGTGTWPSAAMASVPAGVTAAAMVLRWRLPSAATLTAGTATVVGTVLGVCQDPMLATAWCLYPLAVERARRTRVVVGVPAGLLAGLAMVTAVPEGDAAGLGRQAVFAVAALSVAWLLGTVTGEQIATAREGERMRVQLEVARDVHDVVGHALGVIIAQSGVVLSLPDVREEELRDTLSEVETHARRALEDAQALVRTLRAPDGGPWPGLDGVAEIVEATRAAGVDVDARVDVGGAIDDGSGVVVFRIVQEALSNAVRHAPGARCTVRVRREGDVLVVRVRDGGARGAGGRASTAGSGTGLQGMRERARLVGGTVVWGARPGGGFEVEARLPVKSAP